MGRQSSGSSGASCSTYHLLRRYYCAAGPFKLLSLPDLNRQAIGEKGVGSGVESSYTRLQTDGLRRKLQLPAGKLLGENKHLSALAQPKRPSNLSFITFTSQFADSGMVSYASTYHYRPCHLYTYVLVVDFPEVEGPDGAEEQQQRPGDERNGPYLQ
ncbi:hypothetical protein NDU88_003113 [Pleurodeles waltl]|uniref:Uncharacterized protein n=1 Tax=Pleurodeles waltl TaxID=8319 RepID=A0AAV7NNT5_PLEWA|nr:hypothetical protein NDU88_003113 [Pleurodeles waltl]